MQSFWHLRGMFWLLALLGIQGCQQATSPLGDVVSIEVVDVAGTWSDIEDVSIVSGGATSENQKLLNDVRDFAINAFPDGQWVNYGPDSGYRSVRLVCKKGKIELHSWHPGAEQDPGVVASSYGITALDGQSRDEFLRSDDKIYVSKRNAFDEIESCLVSKFK